MVVLRGLVRSRDARSGLHCCLHCSAVSETLHALCLRWDGVVFYRVFMRAASVLPLAPRLHRSSQDSFYREREPETADRGSDGDDANETCAAGAGRMSRNSLKTSAVGAS